MALQGEIVDKMSDLITAAFGLVAALAWNGAIQAIFTEVFGEQSEIPALLAYAVTVTIVAVIATILIGRAAARARAREAAEKRG
ncbi:hypothetical protein FGU65_12720 [Methanoculleus sp. FWC-SCC1]|uniref:Uncharacterized protein n=1 Tax=Methanoculleus frigidifontis TaxID=2584085 RepID=A0ABT8MCR4_9EURY|nr:DUF5654 family protein [Methanoculleus sp. FWC-SCC1]MDN7025732.1 hypothetical protein [Methanoculleus sp. FWC-SCC1]